MLRDKYTFKFTYVSVDLLEESLTKALNVQRETRNEVCALCMLCIKPFVMRLGKILLNPGNTIRVKDKRVKMYTVSLNRTEAVALHIAYRKGMINVHNPLVQELFTEIDKSI